MSHTVRATVCEWEVRTPTLGVRGEDGPSPSLDMTLSGRTPEGASLVVGVAGVVGVNTASADAEPSTSTIPASHLSILALLLSALSHSVFQFPNLFFSDRIFRPASAVATPFTWACSDIDVSEDTVLEVNDRIWVSWGMSLAGVGAPVNGGGGGSEKAVLIGEVAGDTS